jgi:hypothetical protein
MSNVFTRFLGGVGDGLLTPKGGLASWRHASRLFVENGYRLMPRSKFMFYVRFEINKSVLTSSTFTNTHADEIGYLIKSTDLPKYKFETVTKNQYNRKHIVYKNFSYEGISMKFHDDTAGVINALWALYMGAYVQDRHNPEAAFSKTNLQAAGTSFDGFRYSLDRQGKTVDFFKSITIYTMSRRRFLGYTLVNPKITSWQHGDAGYSANEFNEMSMNIEYESVIYSSGNVARDTPKGFANLYYDNVPSPLTVAGGGVGNLLGEGGVLDGLESIFGDVAGGSAFGSVGGFLGTAIKAVNTAKNIGKLSGASLRNEAINVLSSPSAIRGIVGSVGGIVGLVLPKNSGNIDNTPATQRSIVPPPQDLGQFL